MLLSVSSPCPSLRNSRISNHTGLFLSYVYFFLPAITYKTFSRLCCSVYLCSVFCTQCYQCLLCSHVILISGVLLYILSYYCLYVISPWYGVRYDFRSLYQGSYSSVVFQFACVYWWTTICHIICLYVLFPSSAVRDIFRIKINFRFILTPSCFVEGFMSHLCYLCSFAYGGVIHVLTIQAT